MKEDNCWSEQSPEKLTVLFFGGPPGIDVWISRKLTSQLIQHFKEGNSAIFSSGTRQKKITYLYFMNSHKRYSIEAVIHSFVFYNSVPIPLYTAILHSTLAWIDSSVVRRKWVARCMQFHAFWMLHNVRHILRSCTVWEVTNSEAFYIYFYLCFDLPGNFIRFINFYFFLGGGGGNQIFFFKKWQSV